jgi:hypothetical protein
MSAMNLRSNTNQKSEELSMIFGVAAAFMLMVSLIHFVEAPDNYAEAGYKGILFALNGLGALAAAYGIYTRRDWGWWLGLLVASGAIIMYIVSRTVGLPDIGIDSEWFEPMGVLSIIVEGIFVILFGWKFFVRS